MKKDKIEISEVEGLFLALEFLLLEEQEVFTEYGKGLVNGLLDTPGHKCQVVLKKEHDRIVAELKQKWYHKLFKLLKR